MQKLLGLIKEHKGIVLYIVFGILTTAVNYLVYFPLYHIAGFSAVLSNAFAWFVAVLFSFFTNKPLVFESNDWSVKTILHELISFLGCRILTGVMETAVLFAFVDVLKMNGYVWKIIVSVAVVVFNYISSRIFVFRKK